jgi:Lon protease-like protein
MNASPFGVGGLPSEFPIFPLQGALLLPHGKLPLNIFEKRYIAMVEDALAGQRLIGMIQPDASQPDVKTGPAVYGVGCLGRVSSFSETDDGRFLIAISGLIRFDLTGEQPLRRGYRRAIADFSRFLADLRPPAAPLLQRAAVLEALRAYFAANGFDANWSAIEGMADDELVVTLCMVCPFGTAEKQALLEAADPPARAETLLALLRMGAHGTQDNDERRVPS